jgi:hypothetical protein
MSNEIQPSINRRDKWLVPGGLIFPDKATLTLVGTGGGGGWKAPCRAAMYCSPHPPTPQTPPSHRPSPAAAWMAGLPAGGAGRQKE